MMEIGGVAETGIVISLVVEAGMGNEEKLRDTAFDPEHNVQLSYLIWSTIL